MNKPEIGKRYQKVYRGENLYIFLSDKTLDISFSDGKPGTMFMQSGLGLISTATTMNMAYYTPEQMVEEYVKTAIQRNDISSILCRTIGEHFKL